MAKYGFYFCACPDSALLKISVKEISSEVFPKDSEFRISIYRGDEEIPDEFWKAIAMQSFDESNRVIVLRHAESVPIALMRRLSDLLGRVNPQVMTIVCLESQWEKKSGKLPVFTLPKILSELKCVQFARKKKWWREIPPLNQRTIQDFIRQRADSLKINVPQDTLRVLADAMPLDAAAVLSEMAKLALLAASRAKDGEIPTLIPEDANLIKEAVEFDIFELINNLQNGKVVSVWTDLKKDAPDAILFPLISNLRTAARDAWQILSKDTSSSLNVYALKYRQALDNKLRLQGIIKLFDALHIADLSVKTGNASTSQALDRLIADLTLLFA